MWKRESPYPKTPKACSWPQLNNGDVNRVTGSDKDTIVRRLDRKTLQIRVVLLMRAI
jgi:hypothetical protein